MAQENKRENLSKKVRFEVFKRDYFTCQYCGNQPPEVVLAVDHIHPVSKGGSNDASNLITACYGCNAGKSDKLLEDRIVRPDADLMLLEAHQEIGELEMWQEANALRVAERKRVVLAMQDIFQDLSGEDWVPSDAVLLNALEGHSAEELETAVRVTARKIYDDPKMSWVPYLRGVLRRLREQRNG